MVTKQNLRITKSRNMVETLSRNNNVKENLNQMEFMNAFGIVFKNYFVVYDISTKIRVNIEDTKFVSMRKSRKITKNIFLIAVSVYMIIGTYSIVLSLLYKGIFSSIALLILILGVFYKEYQYKFTIIKHDDCIEFKVKKNLKEDAKKIQRILTEKIKKK